MRCFECQFENSDSMRFCVDCGTRLAAPCSRCGAEMQLVFRFCGQCGEEFEPSEDLGPRPTPALPTDRAAAEAPVPKGPSESERKPVTVLSCELAASDAAASPDALHELLSSFFEVAKEEVERYGGTMNRVSGQGFMAIFGAPVAYEDHPNRAILAARGIRQHFDASDVAGISIGIDTGEVVVGGAGDMVVGEPTEFATTLHRHAEPGQILMSDATARLVRTQISVEKAKTLTDSGGAEQPTWAAVEDGDAEFSSPFTNDNVSPLIGRDNDLQLLEDLRDKASEGLGQVVALTGEAGSGKSRLLHELYMRTFAGGGGVSYLRGQCVSYGTGIPYLPLADLIRKASRILESDDHDTIRSKLESSLQGVGTQLEGTLPFLLRLLGVKEGTEALEELEPQAIQARTFAAMRRMLLDATHNSLVVLEIEDLQWIDDTSAEFLDSLVDAMAAARMLVLLTYRSGYQPKWLEKSYAHQISMSRLSESDSRRLVSSLLSRAGLPEDLSSEILDKAEGNPFFLEEMAQAVIDGGGDTAVPDTVQGMLMARIDRLPDEHKQLLRTASVLGRELSMELLEALWERPARLGPLLDDLQGWELIYKAPSEDQVTFFFRQALTQEVTYQSLLENQRKTLHAKAAARLEELYEGRLDDAFDRLIYHYPKAGLPEKTVYYLTLFAQQAAEGYAHREAAKALREALLQSEDLPAPERERRLIEVQLQLAESLLPLAGFPETLELFQKNLERLEALEDPSVAGKYYFWLAHTYTYLGMQEETQTYADKSIAAATECNDEITEGKARYVLGRDGFWSGHFKQGIENSLRAVVLLERNGEPWWQGQAFWVAGFNHYVLGQFEEAIDSLERAYALSEALDDYRLDTSWSLGYFYASLGEADIGIEQCKKGLEASQDPLNSAVSTGFLGHALLQKGELDSAVSHLKDAAELMAGVGMTQLEGWFSAILGEALLAQENHDAARKAAERGLKASEEARFWYGVGLAQSSLGRIALEAGRYEEAQDWLRQARERFEELDVPLEVARIDLDLGNMARRMGDDSAKQENYQRAVAGFEALEVPFWIERATGEAAR